MSNRIVWLEVASSNIPASADFYRKLFDWPIVTDEKMNYTMTNFGMNETGIGFSPIDEEQGVTPGSVLVYVGVENADAVIDRARSLGAQIILDKTEIPTIGWMAIFADPGGNRIGILEPVPMES